MLKPRLKAPSMTGIRSPKLKALAKASFKLGMKLHALKLPLPRVRLSRTGRLNLLFPPKPLGAQAALSQEAPQEPQDNSPDAPESEGEDETGTPTT